MIKRHTHQERTKHIAQWRKSGLSQRAYCQQNGLSWTAFKNWDKRQQPVKSEPQFAPVEITQLTDVQWIIETTDGLRVHVPAHSDEKSLRKWINALRSSDAS